MVEQDREHLWLEIAPADAGRGSHGDEIAAEEHVHDFARIEDRLRQRAGLGGFGGGEFARALLHDRLAGQELEARGVGRGFGLDEHASDVGRRAVRGKEGTLVRDIHLAFTHRLPIC